MNGIEGVRIEIFAGNYKHDNDDDAPAYINPVFRRTIELNLGKKDACPINEELIQYIQKQVRSELKRIQLEYLYLKKFDKDISRG